MSNEYVRWLGWRVAYPVGDGEAVDAYGKPVLQVGLVIEAYSTGFVQLTDGMSSYLVAMSTLYPVGLNAWSAEDLLAIWNALPRPGGLQ